jgi:Leucine-rich repeat (LRR) protein
LLSIALLSLTSSQQISHDCTRLINNTCFIEAITNNSSNNNNTSPNFFKLSHNHVFKTLVIAGIDLELLEIDENLGGQVEVLVVENSGIEDLTSDDLRLMTRLTDVTFTSGFLRRILNGAFDSQVLMETLGLAKNKIYHLDADIFMHQVNLKKLDLHGNKLQVLPANLLKQTVNLVEINLSHNGLLTLNSQLFKNTPKLKVIDVTGNGFIHLDQHTFDGLSLISLKATPSDDCRMHGYENAGEPIDLDEVREDIRDDCTATDFKVYWLHAKIHKINEKNKNLKKN